MKAESLIWIIFPLIGLILSVNFFIYDLEKVDHCRAIGDKECVDWYSFLAMIQLIFIIVFLVIIFLNLILDREIRNFY